MAKVKAEATAEAKEKAPTVVTVEVKDGYNKELTLYFAGIAIHFKDGKATVKADVAKALKQGGYVK